MGTRIKWDEGISIWLSFQSTTGSEPSAVRPRKAAGLETGLSARR